MFKKKTLLLTEGASHQGKGKNLLKKLIKLSKFDNIKIGIKLSVSFGLVIVCSLVLIIFLSLGTISETFIDQAEKDTYELLKQSGDNLKGTLEEIDKLAMAVSRDGVITPAIEKLNNASDEASKARQASVIKPFLDAYYGSRVDTLLDLIITDKRGYGVLAGDGSFQELRKKYVDTIAAKEFIASKSRSFWLDTYETDIAFSRRINETRTITLFKSVYTPTSLNNSVGMLQVNIRESALHKLIRDVRLPHQGRFYIVGELGNMVLNPNNLEDNGLLVSELNMTDKNGDSMAKHMGKTDITYQDEKLDKPLFKLGAVNNVSEEFKKSLRERDEYITNEILKAVSDRVNDAGINNGEKTETFGGIIDEHLKVNGKQMSIAYYHIHNISGTPIKWTMVSLTPVEKIVENVNRAALQVFIIGLLCLLVGIGISGLIAMDISSGIKALTNLMNRIKGGDLEVECNINRRDEIGMMAISFEDMVANLKKLIASVKQASDVAVESSQSVTSSCQQSYASIEQFSSMLSEMKNEIDLQTGEIEVNGKIVDELSCSIQTMTDNFGNVNRIVSGAKELSENGKKSVNTLKTNANEVKKTIAEFSKLIDTLKVESSEISKITGFIRGIAKQTNLLALNAAIEAVRAGEAGRSFSIVASEIRILAEQSNDSVNYIENKLKNISDTIQMTGEFIKSSDSVIGGHDFAVGDTTDKFDNIVGFMDKIFNQMRDITDSMHYIEQARANIIESMKKLNSSTGKTKDNVQTISESMDEQVQHIRHLLTLSDDLNTLSLNLEKTINIFRV